MFNLDLWKSLETLKNDYDWVDLTHKLDPLTPHWAGWEALEVKQVANLNSSLFDAHIYTTVGQYGTHVDAPSHMVKKSRTLDEITLKEMIYPLCIIDKSEEVEKNNDYCLTKQDILDWEEQFGLIPPNAFVAFKSNWSHRPADKMDNLDNDGKRHFPGWSLESLKFLIEERNIGSIGHETSDTEAPILSEKSNYEVEYYILAQDRIQVELLKGLDKCPNVGAIIVCSFPKLTGGSGYPARCFAICPRGN